MKTKEKYQGGSQRIKVDLGGSQRIWEEQVGSLRVLLDLSLFWWILVGLSGSWWISEDLGGSWRVLLLLSSRSEQTRGTAPRGVTHISPVALIPNEAQRDRPAPSGGESEVLLLLDSSLVDLLEPPGVFP